MPTKEREPINKKPRERVPSAKPVKRRPMASRASKPVRSGRSSKSQAVTGWGGWTANTDWPELIKDLAGLALLVFGVVVLFSLFSYDPLDASPNQAGPH